MATKRTGFSPFLDAAKDLSRKGGNEDPSERVLIALSQGNDSLPQLIEFTSLSLSHVITLVEHLQNAKLIEAVGSDQFKLTAAGERTAKVIADRTAG